MICEILKIKRQNELKIQLRFVKTVRGPGARICCQHAGGTHILHNADDTVVSHAYCILSTQNESSSSAETANDDRDLANLIYPIYEPRFVFINKFNIIQVHEKE